MDAIFRTARSSTLADATTKSRFAEFGWNWGEIEAVLASQPKILNAAVILPIGLGNKDSLHTLRFVLDRIQTSTNCVVS